MTNNTIYSLSSKARGSFYIWKTKFISLLYKLTVYLWHEPRYEIVFKNPSCPIQNKKYNKLWANKDVAPRASKTSEKIPESLIYQTVTLLSSDFHTSGLTDFSTTTTHHTGNKTHMAILICSQKREIIFCLGSTAAGSQCMMSAADTLGTIIQTKTFYINKTREEIVNFKTEISHHLSVYGTGQSGSACITWLHLMQTQVFWDVTIHHRSSGSIHAEHVSSKRLVPPTQWGSVTSLEH